MEDLQMKQRAQRILNSVFDLLLLGDYLVDDNYDDDDVEEAWDFIARSLRLNSVFDLLLLGDYLVDDNYDDDDVEEAWDFIARSLRLKTTFLFCDFNQLISYSPQAQKETLTRLANKLFCSIEELDHVVKLRSIPFTQDLYNETAIVLEEVVAIFPQEEEEEENDSDD